MDEIGPSLRYASAKVARAQRSGGGGGGGGFTGSSGPVQNDPWASQAGGAGGFADEPPF